MTARVHARVSSMDPGARQDWIRGGCGIATLLVALLLSPGYAAENPAGTDFFEKRVRPLLAEQCHECHGPEKHKGNLRLDSVAGIRAGGQNGPVIVPGRPEESRLVQAVRRTDPDLAMPPKSPLTERQVQILTAWVEAGAPMPEETDPGGTRGEGARLRTGQFRIRETDRAHWAFQPVRPVAVPETPAAEAVANPVDAFILARLAAEGLTMQAEASRRELMRRLCFDLIGLPPEPGWVEAFEADRAPDAWERWVDRLLASPRYGERWGRHWLDLVRYGETNGYERDGAKPYAWRYRDYVIQSFNADKPYDRFLREQIAGDLIEPFSREALVATGFYRLHVWDDEPDSTLAAEYDDLDDILSTIGGSMLGLTLGCARCHDHKYEPISQMDYYAMLAHVRNIEPYGLHHKGGGGRGTGRIVRPLAARADADAWIAVRDRRLAEARQAVSKAPEGDARREAEQRLRVIEAEEPPEGFGLVISQAAIPAKPTHLLHRGDPQAPGPLVSPGIPQVLAKTAARHSITNDTAGQDGRLELANWIASRSNPLTARVWVNRVWQHHFGRGLAPNPSDLGTAAEPPSHPELVDYLAEWFMAEGWHTKALHRLILTSRTYRLTSRTEPGSTATAPPERADPDNRLYGRQNLRRVEAEVLRDSMLAVAGTMQWQSGGPGFYPDLPKEVHATQDSSGKGWGQSSAAEQARRSIYMHVKRALLLPLLETFDYATASTVLPVRPVTTVAPQALFLLNDELVHTQAARLAARVEIEAGGDSMAQVRRAFALVLQRRPTPEEESAARGFLSSVESFTSPVASAAAEGRAPAASSRAGLTHLCLCLLNLNEFVYVD